MILSFTFMAHSTATPVLSTAFPLNTSPKHPEPILSNISTLSRGISHSSGFQSMHAKEFFSNR
jgi:hypothetical protein